MGNAVVGADDCGRILPAGGAPAAAIVARADESKPAAAIVADPGESRRLRRKWIASAIPWGYFARF
jgi:hypothetical protein